MKMISFDCINGIELTNAPYKGSEYQGLFTDFNEIYKLLIRFPEDKAGHAVVTDTVFQEIEGYFGLNRR